MPMMKLKAAMEGGLEELALYVAGILMMKKQRVKGNCT
jgi:hypothetical protein